VQQQAKVTPRIEAERGQPILELLCHVLFRFAGADAERAAHDFYEREERRLLAVGRAASCKDKRAFADPLTELVQQA
jgi:hypothetical protein